MQQTYVLYHAKCFDGSGAAFAAWTALGDEGVTYIPVNYGEQPPSMESGSKVYLVDFSYPRDVLEALAERMGALVVLDHHKTAKEALEGFPGAYFDMRRSGAVMAWNYFHPEVPVPTLLLHVQDRDLWEWKLNGTKEITQALALYPNFRDWEKLAFDPEALSNLREIGSVKLQFDELALRGALSNAVVTTYEGYTCALLNTTTLVSEIGERLYTELEVDFSITFFVHQSGDVVFSFRSKKGGVDVSQLAKALGGGGHPGAAGARVDTAAGYTMLQQLYNPASD